MQLVHNLLAAAILLVALVPAFGQSLKPSGVLSQEKIGKNGCGPCALVNSLMASGDKASLAQFEADAPLGKVREFIDEVGGLPSIPYGTNRTAYSDEHGTADLDLLHIINVWRKSIDAPQLKGEFIKRQVDETPEAFVRRMHRTINTSVKSGFVPIMAVRSAKAEDMGERFLWNAISGHWICVESSRLFSRGATTASLSILDSYSGSRLPATLYAEPRKATVPLTFDVDADGKEVWHWEKSANCLFLHSPGMPLGTERAKWHERTYIAARYLIYADQPVEKGIDR